MSRRISIVLGGILALVALLIAFPFPIAPNTAVAAGGASVRGVVTDSGGKAIRGAVVRATADGRTVARYSNRDGRYEIEGLSAGQYEVSVNAYGYELAKQTKDTAQSGETNFKLAPQNDVTRLTSAELRYLFPETEEALNVYSSCSTCHGLETVLSRRGMPAAAWQGFLGLREFMRCYQSLFSSSPLPSLQIELTSANSTFIVVL